MNKLIGLAILLSCFCSQSKAIEKIKFSVFLTAERSGGFIDAGVSDSLKDMRGYFSKYFTLADSAQKADIVFTVTRRAIGSEIIGNKTTFGKGIFGSLFATNTKVEEKKCYVFAVLQSGDYTQDWWGSGPFWREASKAIAKAIDKWSKTNRDELILRRGLK
jgi:hypothetical protein